MISGGCPFPGAHSSVITAARSVMVISGGCPYCRGSFLSHYSGTLSHGDFWGLSIPGGSLLSHYSGTLSHGNFWRLPFPAAHSSVITVARSVMVISGGCPFPGAHSSVITAARSVMVISGGCPLPGLIPQSLQWHAQSW